MTKFIAQCTRCNQKVELHKEPLERLRCKECNAVMQVYTSYTMSGEELEKYKSLPVPETDKKPVGVRPASRELEIRRHKEKPKEDIGMAAIKEGPNCGLTREIFIEQIAKGETISSIERAWEMKNQTLHYWVKRWGLKGIDPVRARKMLSDIKGPMLHEKEVLAPEAPKEKNTLQQEIDKLRQANTDIKAECERLLQERDDYKQAAEDLEDSVADQDQIVEMLNKTKQRLTDLEKEHGDLLLKLSFLEADRGRLLEPVELTIPDPEPADMVNHPPHYNRGGIECIEAIDAATTGLEGQEAYNTGAAIKYIWRWKFKNGIEDLKKAAWHLNRLISGNADVS